PQVRRLPARVLGQQEDVLVRAPDRLPQVALGLLDVLLELSPLGLVELQVAAFVLDVFPGKSLSGFLPECFGVLRNGPEECALECPSGASVLPRRRLDEVSRQAIAD